VFAWDMLRWQQLVFHIVWVSGEFTFLISPAPFSLLRHGEWAQHDLQPPGDNNTKGVKGRLSLYV
jgi:hypothetical protein